MKPANFALRGGRDLKQRRSGLFWSLPIPSFGVGSTEEALLLPAVRCGALPNPSSDTEIGDPNRMSHRRSTEVGVADTMRAVARRGRSASCVSPLAPPPRA